MQKYTDEKLKRQITIFLELEHYIVDSHGHLFVDELLTLVGFDEIILGDALLARFVFPVALDRLGSAPVPNEVFCCWSTVSLQLLELALM